MRKPSRFVSAVAERGYHDLIMAGAAAQEARKRLSDAEFMRLYARAHMAGLQAAWGVFGEALQPKRDNVRRLDGHHPSKLAG
jgi:hypothetical protein